METRADLVHVTNPGLLLRMDSLLSDGLGGWNPQFEVTIDPSGSNNPASPSWRTAEVDGDGSVIWRAWTSCKNFSKY